MTDIMVDQCFGAVKWLKVYVTVDAEENRERSIVGKRIQRTCCMV